MMRRPKGVSAELDAMLPVEQVRGDGAVEVMHPNVVSAAVE